MKNKIYVATIIAFTLQSARAQWTQHSSGLPSGSTIIEMSAPEKQDCYASFFASDFSLPNELAITHNCGDTWNSDVIDSLQDDYLIDVWATSKNTVYVLGWNYVAGGGDVFRSKDAGVTWQREASHAFNDPASFPDDIAFFDSKNGVMIGDPVNGSFQIYTTRNGGNHWHQVSASKIPIPLSGELGGAFYMEIYGHTVWAGTIEYDAYYNIVGGRLLQSDDMGETWYVRNQSMPVESNDLTFKFRDLNNGLFKNNGKLYRTTDGGSTYTQVNYTGTWFPFDIDYVKGVTGCWISTGGAFGSIAGSSISFDDGDSWTTLDTNVVHSCVQMVNKHSGFTGGISSGNDDGVFVYTGAPLRQSTATTPCDETTMKVYPNPSSDVFTLDLNAEDNEEGTLRVFNMQGQLMQQQNFTAPSTIQFGENLPLGMYIVQLQTARKVYSTRIIKTN